MQISLSYIDIKMEKLHFQICQVECQKASSERVGVYGNICQSGNSSSWGIVANCHLVL